MYTRDFKLLSLNKRVFSKSERLYKLDFDRFRALTGKKVGEIEEISLRLGDGPVVKYILRAGLESIIVNGDKVIVRNPDTDIIDMPSGDLWFHEIRDIDESSVFAAPNLLSVFVDSYFLYPREKDLKWQDTVRDVLPDSDLAMAVKHVTAVLIEPSTQNMFEKNSWKLNSGVALENEGSGFKYLLAILPKVLIGDPILILDFTANCLHPMTRKVFVNFLKSERRVIIPNELID